MSQPKFARPYAKAAFEYAMEHQQLDQWAAMLHNLAQLIEQPVVQQVLKNPKYSSEMHAKICMELSEGLMDAAGQNFIKILAKNRRLSVLPSIFEQFEALRASVEKTLTVQVKSAIPLSQEYQQQLIALLSAKFGRHIILQCKVAKELLGGLVIAAGDHVIDGSVKGQLERMREAIVS